MDAEPLDPHVLKKHVRECLKEIGNVRFSTHAMTEMAKDDMSTGDVLSVLRAGIYDGNFPPEFQFGTWRYRVYTKKFAVIVALRESQSISVVTAWRFK